LLAMAGSARELNPDELRTFEITVSGGTGAPVPAAATTDTQTTSGPDDRSTESTEGHNVEPATETRARLKAVNQSAVQNSAEQASDAGKTTR
jgi:hypothetical protein